MKSKSEEIPQNEDGTYTIEIDPENYEKIEKLIERHRKEEEEEDDGPIWHKGIEYANMQEFRRLTGRGH